MQLDSHLEVVCTYTWNLKSLYWYDVGNNEIGFTAAVTPCPAAARDAGALPNRVA